MARERNPQQLLFSVSNYTSRRLPSLDKTRRGGRDEDEAGIIFSTPFLGFTVIIGAPQLFLLPGYCLR